MLLLVQLQRYLVGHGCCYLVHGQTRWWNSRFIFWLLILLWSVFSAFGPNSSSGVLFLLLVLVCSSCMSWLLLTGIMTIIDFVILSAEYSWLLSSFRMVGSLYNMVIKSKKILLTGEVSYLTFITMKNRRNKLFNLCNNGI